LVEKFPTVLEKLPQVLRVGDFFDSHCRTLVKASEVGIKVSKIQGYDPNQRAV